MPERIVIFRQALRNAMLPRISVLAQDFGFLIGGIVAVETIFAYPGVGRLLVYSLSRHDLPLMQAAVLVITAIYCLANLAADLLYGVFNPRIRYGRAVDRSPAASSGCRHSRRYHSYYYDPRRPDGELAGALSLRPASCPRPTDRSQSGLLGGHRRIWSRCAQPYPVRLAAFLVSWVRGNLDRSSPRRPDRVGGRILSRACRRVADARTGCGDIVC